MHLFTICLFSLCSFGDVHREELDQKKQAYSDKVESAKKQLLKGFDDAIKDVAKTGNLDLVKTINQEKEEFLSLVTLPASKQLARSRSEYENSLRTARIELNAAFEKARTEYTKVLDLKNAEIVDQEFKDFLQKEKNKHLNDLLVKTGTEWAGTYRVSSSKGVSKTDYVMIVRKRDNDQIEYELWQENHSRGLLFRGKLNGGSLKSQCVEVLKGKFSPDTIGGINTGSFVGKRFVHEEYDKSKKVNAYLELLLVDSNK
jgi:hypothetical protein